MASGFEGRVVVVTGAAAGIGASTARAFAEQGARVIAVDRDDTGLAAVCGEIAGRGGRADGRRVDVADDAAVAQLFADIEEQHGRLDVLHANAGVEWTKPVVDTELAEWNRVLGVNLDGVFLCGRAALRMMRGQGAGAIVITSSPHATRTVPDAGAYAASKGGTLALARAMALEAAPFGVRVNAVVPGAIDTPMLHREAEAAADPAAQLRRFGEMHPLGRLGRPEEIAAAVLFLAGDQASFVTGAALYVDGGQDAVLSSGPALGYGG